MPRDIALIGKMRSGKDTAAARLCETHDYVRLAFADPLKEAALKLDPIVYHDSVFGYYRLSEIVAADGWDSAKDEYPEVRRVLQHFGQGVRDLDPSFWLFELLRKYRATPDPVVVTDVRYLNEARTLRKRGFKLVRIIRPEASPNSGSTATHASETELDDYPCDVTLNNAGSLAELREAVDALAQGA
jgi:Dephospho-CoA kinase